MRRARDAKARKTNRMRDGAPDRRVRRRISNPLTSGSDLRNQELLIAEPYVVSLVEPETCNN
jgi:hypothetical protein